MSASSTPVLLTSAQSTSTTALLTGAAARRGLATAVLTGPDTVEELAGRPVHWYGGPLAAARIAAPLGLALLEPEDDWLARLPEEFTRRRIELTTLAEAWTLRHPAFVKPPADKSVQPAVYPDGSRLPRSGERIGPDTPVLISEPVTFAAEYRLFLRDGEVLTGSRYARFGRLDPAPLTAAATAFAHRLLDAVGDTLPSAVALDVGPIADPYDPAEHWAVVEANLPWFAHCYAADPDRVLDVVLRAAGPAGQLAESDRRFVRTIPTIRTIG
ncbi:ATP-grasp domain-containing protein [Kitasatospora cathayae]|uniref:ATP-grasp domain-containing protein n=1 Tax=Kitasatospora cathayae TaxID=3004092 RepID=A0ABY7Q050_9ACTN|nr:ATP-grasp domain-containing protein [Kitasatospora sp. HUAS 3-15]WBP85991.1 ATP-grasp domain-containing protein [Kitasatospora sp. HUAS 3-15]